MEEAARRRPVLQTACQVVGIVVVHGLITAGIVAAAGYTEEQVGPVPRYWAVVTLVPSLLWAVIVLTRAAAWRRASSFWLPGAAAIVAILAFVSGMLLRFGPLDLPGVGFGMLVSSWILITLALVVAFATQGIRALRRGARRTAAAHAQRDAVAEPQHPEA